MMSAYQDLSSDEVASGCCEYSISNQWFAFRCSMVLEGGLRSMTNAAMRVYLVLKAHANVHSGKAFPSLQRIASMAGMSVSQAQRGVKQLQMSEHVIKRRVGRKNYYTIMEQELIRNQSSQITHVATWIWRPSKQKLISNELKKIRTLGVGGEFQYVSVKKVQAATNPGSIVSLHHPKIPGTQDLMHQLKTAPSEVNRILLRLRDAISTKEDA